MPRAFAGRAGQLRWPTLLVLLFMTVSGASAQTAYRVRFKQLVDQSDTIFVAQCVDKETTFSHGEIITRYRLRPVDVWKGSPRIDGRGEMKLEELGGELEGKIPMASQVTGMANIGKGQEVLLFTREPGKSATTKATTKTGPIAADSPRLVGMSQGRFEVFKHPETGKRLVTRGESGPLDEAIARQKAKTQRPGQPPTDADRKAARSVDEKANFSRQRREAAAKIDPTMADEIHEYESLDDVKSRVQARLGLSK